MRIFSFLLLVDLGYCPAEFVHTNAMLVLNKNRYDYKFSDKNNALFYKRAFLNFYSREKFIFLAALIVLWYNKISRNSF